MTTQDFRGITYTIETLTGNDQTFQGTRGNDWVEAPGSNNIISTDKGNDVILAGLEFLFIGDYPPYGGSAIFYSPLPEASTTVGNEIIDAGSGDDYVAVGKGNYIVDLGKGNNIFDGGTATGNIQISAGNGNDIIDAGSGNYKIDAGGGNNWIYLAGGNASVSAGNGNDIIDAGSGNYKIDAGGGNNWISLAGGNASVSAGSGNDVITTNIGGVFALLSYLDGEGKPYKQVIDAGKGNNQIGLTVFGQTSITTGSGQDFVLAYSVSTLFGIGEVNSDSVDILTGSGNDTVITIDTKSLINTGSGDDLVIAGAGDDTIYAGSGNDVINLRGGTFSIPSPLDNLGFFGLLFGSEVPVQGGGNDTVYLESGNDTVILGSSGFATIYDFGKNDRLDVSGLNATFTRMGHDTLISSGSNSLGILKEYTGSVALV
ncbi:calcium-binding protein [Nostoc sp.]|uniref:calcium-binding protein n=1 Tax=Nostoc sp. TaxID=1180 RepID=UPI002FFCF8B8